MVVSRKGHPFAVASTLASYCAAGHLVVSQTGEAHGSVDLALTDLGAPRRIVLTAPVFFMAFALVAQTNLICAVPRSFAEGHGHASGLVMT